MLLGVRSNEDYAQTKFEFETADRLLVYTDDLVEAVNAQGEAFGETRLPQFITIHEELPAEPLAARLLDDVFGWPGKDNTRAAQADDITAVVIDIAKIPNHLM